MIPESVNQDADRNKNNDPDHSKDNSEGFQYAHHSVSSVFGLHRSWWVPVPAPQHGTQCFTPGWRWHIQLHCWPHLQRGLTFPLSGLFRTLTWSPAYNTLVGYRKRLWRSWEHRLYRRWPISTRISISLFEIYSFVLITFASGVQEFTNTVAWLFRSGGHTVGTFVIMHKFRTDADFDTNRIAFGIVFEVSTLRIRRIGCHHFAQWPHTYKDWFIHLWLPLFLTDNVDTIRPNTVPRVSNQRTDADSYDESLRALAKYSLVRWPASWRSSLNQS